MEETREILGMMEVENTMEEQQRTGTGVEETAEKASGRQGGGLLDLAKEG